MTGNRSNNFVRKAGIALALLIAFYLCLFWVQTGLGMFIKCVS